MNAPALGRLVCYTHKTADMVAFYCTHFGFTVDQTPGDRIVELIPSAGGASLLLHPASQRQKDGQVMLKMVFDVEDVARFCEDAAAQGLTFSKIYNVDGYSFANAKDPAGNSVQVSSRVFRSRG